MVIRRYKILAATLGIGGALGILDSSYCSDEQSRGGKETQILVLGDEIEADGMDAISMTIIYGMNKFFYKQQKEDFPDERIEQCRAAITSFRMSEGISAWYSEGKIQQSSGILEDLESGVHKPLSYSTETMDYGFWSDGIGSDRLVSLIEGIQDGYISLGYKVAHGDHDADITHKAILKQREYLIEEYKKRVKVAYHYSLKQAQAFFDSHPELPQNILVTLDSNYWDVPVDGYHSLLDYIDWQEEHPHVRVLSCLSPQERALHRENARSTEKALFSHANRDL